MRTSWNVTFNSWFKESWILSSVTESKCIEQLLSDSFKGKGILKDYSCVLVAPLVGVEIYCVLYWFKKFWEVGFAERIFLAEIRN